MGFSTGDSCRKLGEPKEKVIETLFNQAGTRLASLDWGSDWVVRIWDISSGQQGRRLEGHNALIWNTAFTPDGSYIAEQVLMRRL